MKIKKKKFIQLIDILKGNWTAEFYVLKYNICMHYNNFFCSAQNM